MPVLIEDEVCKGCGICVALCKKGVLRISNRRNQKGANIAEVCEPMRCVDCRICEASCPDLAIWVVEDALDRLSAGV
jgi:2-oxoglutarate ferredoxin oxidoreductase subunit delta